MHLNLTFSSPINLHKWLTSYIRIYTKRSLCKMQAGGASSIAFQVLEMQLSGSTSLTIQLCASAFQAAADASRSCWIMQKRQKRCNRTILTTLLLDSCCMSSLSGCGSECVCARGGTTLSSDCVAFAARSRANLVKDTPRMTSRAHFASAASTTDYCRVAASRRNNVRLHSR